MDFLKRKPTSKKNLNELSFQNNQLQTSQKALKLSNFGNLEVDSDSFNDFQSRSKASIADSCDLLRICSDCETKLKAMRERQSTATANGFQKPLCTIDAESRVFISDRRSGCHVSDRPSTQPGCQVSKVSTDGSRLSYQSGKKCANCGSSFFISQSSSISIKICLKCLEKEKIIADQGRKLLI
jgi:hypothetical protein